MLLQSHSQIISLPQRHISNQNIKSLDNYESNFYDLKKVGMADGNDTGDTMMIEHETRTKLNSPSASSTPPSPSSPKSSLADDKPQSKNPDHNGNAAAEDSIVKNKSHPDDSSSIPTTQSMTASNAASFSFQTLMGALGSLPPAMATAAFQSLANMSPGAGSPLPPAILSALPPEMATIMQQLNAGLPHIGGAQPPHPHHLSSPSSMSSDTVSSYVGEHQNNDRSYQGKTNNNNDIAAVQSPPLSRQKLNVSNDCDEQNEREGAPDTPPSSIPGRLKLYFFEYGFAIFLKNFS